MKAYSPELDAALLEGEVISVGAVKIATAESPALVWGGHGSVELDGEVYTGIGQAGLISVTGGQLGSAEQSIDLTLSGVDPSVLSVLSQIDARRAPVVIWRLFFSGTGATILGAHVFARGRIDGLSTEETAGGTATIRARVESAARGLGRQTGRMRADADQRLVDGNDGGFQWVTQAPSRQLAWGGKPPTYAAAALPNAIGAQMALEKIMGQVL